MIFERSPNPKISRVYFVFEIGSHDDPSGKEGLVCFTAENVLRFLVRGKKLGEQIEQLGGELSTVVDRTHTTFELTVLKENAISALGLLAESWSNPVCRKEEVEILRNSTIGELETEYQDPIWLGRAGILRLGNSPSVSHPIGGMPSSVRSFKTGDVIETFTHKLIRARASIAICGWDDREKNAVSELAKILKEDFKNREFDPPAVSQSRAIIIHKKGLSTNPFFIAQQSVSDSDPAKLVLELGNHSFGGDFTSRLSQELRVKNGWTYYCSSGFSQILEPKNKPTFFSVHAAPRSEVTGEAMRRSIDMLNEYFAKGISKDEFESSKKALFYSYLFDVDTAEKRVDGKLRELLTGRQYLPLEDYEKTISRIDRSQLNEILRGFKGRSFIASVVGDENKLRPKLEKEFDFEQVETIDSEKIVGS